MTPLGARWEGSMHKKGRVLSSYAYVLPITRPGAGDRSGANQTNSAVSRTETTEFALGRNREVALPGQLFHQRFKSSHQLRSSS